MKSLCIVGGGPAGLVAAKTFIQTEQFNVTVYEKNDRIGGIWALDRESKDGFLSPFTPTNLSRFTVGFSDLDWKNVDYGEDCKDLTRVSQTNAHKPPMFPKAWMANRYLEMYRKKYIPDSVIHFGIEVHKVEQSGSGWDVTAIHGEGEVKCHHFDYLIMASGFFAKPRSIEQSVAGMSNGTPDLPVRIIHSSAFRDLNHLFSGTGSVKGKKILMLGGGNSSGETAAAVALQLSNAQWSPDRVLAAKYKDMTIVHVTPRPIYALPHFNEYEEGSRSYVPLDFKLYDFGRRPASVGSYAGKQTMEVRDMVHGMMQGMVGGDQSDISPALVSAKGAKRGTTYVALTESYPEYVRSGLIDVVPGRVERLLPNEDGTVSAHVEQQGEENTLKDVAAIIYANGYNPSSALEILDDATKEAIKYDAMSLRLPMILEQWQTTTRDLRNISFLGFYEGPYWGMMEMQAKLTAHRWLDGRLSERRWYEAKDKLLALRQSMHDKAADVPQFWFSDYLGYLEDIANELGLDKNHQAFGEREGCISPARYLSPSTNKAEANAIMDELHQEWHECLTNGKYVPRAAFRAFHGKWNITRKIQSASSTFPSGVLEGTASFHPRLPTIDKFDLEYIYVESGTFTTSTGFAMNASRRYVYRYTEATDSLSVWFVKPDKPLEVDYLFHELQFVKPAEARKAGACIAKADHLCIKDMYTTSYRIPLRGIALREFEVTHIVKGPEKDYVATTQVNPWDEYDLSPWPLANEHLYREPAGFIKNAAPEWRVLDRSLTVYPGTNFPAPKKGFTGNHKGDYSSAIRDHAQDERGNKGDLLLRTGGFADLNWWKICAEINTEEAEKIVWKTYKHNLRKKPKAMPAKPAPPTLALRSPENPH
ncbi:uncharacterized protein LTR77_000525 [Saxophila tyrrhenica]|uniref:DUF6314 domain-containing protein n=1 Tax=Saxophila tyrrhenica TaxID=1690608 RepID=A0AAV9PNU1_9PEZI|nr:hypothetical protein LTR77_000525 [Saxophila tyrrhenica]